MKERYEREDKKDAEHVLKVEHALRDKVLTTCPRCKRAFKMSYGNMTCPHCGQGIKI